MNEALTNLEAEQSLLGALLSRSDAWALLDVRLKPDHFGEGIHARIFDAAQTMNEGGQAPSAITLATQLGGDEALKGIGGRAYLGSLIGQSAPSIHIASLVDLICDLSARREAVRLANELVESAENVSQDAPFRPAIAQLSTPV
jgi:replicative DNA helicase